jgi:choline dehydrogenase
VCQLRPESTGSIALASADPFAPPKIFANYLATETDRRCTTAAMAFARKLAATAPLSGYVAAEMSPGPNYVGDADLLRFARGHGATIFHPVATCRMGVDDAAVVDPRLHLKGIDGLWVADCSIMPTLPSGNTNVPAIMVGEKASDMILEDVSRG